MRIATYTQNQKLQNHIAYIGRFTDDVKCKDFGKYYLDVVREYGTSRNTHGIEHTKDLKLIESWLADNNFIKVP